MLTDEEFFGGSVADLQAARAATSAARAAQGLHGVAARRRRRPADGRRLPCCSSPPPSTRPSSSSSTTLATDVGLDVLVEVHDEPELEQSDRSCGATLVGVNQRDLVTFEVDHDRAARMAKAMPAGVTTVAESGVRDRDDAKRLADAGYDAILVGETLVTAGDPTAALRDLVTGRSDAQPFSAPTFAPWVK